MNVSGNKTYDSLIFDMDGTLWDAVDSYCAVWNAAYRELRLPYHLEREQLVGCMGLPLEEIYRRVAPGAAIGYKEFVDPLRRHEKEMMPCLGGRLYPGVTEGLAELKKRGYELFMVSNCSPEGLPNFMRFTGLGPLFTDYLSYGATGVGKAGNIKALQKRYNLESPIYVGDIEADCRSAHDAGIDMLWVSYGFGRCTDSELTAASFGELVRQFPSLNANHQ